MFLHGSFVTLILAVALAGSQPISQNNGPLPTCGELLKRHNIQLTQPALVDALRNTDPAASMCFSALKLTKIECVEATPGHSGRGSLAERTRPDRTRDDPHGRRAGAARSTPAHIGMPA